MNAKAISTNSRNDGCGRFFLIPFGFIFASIGMVFLVLTFAWPLWQSRQASSWHQAQCEITKSEVKTNHDSDGNSYEPIVEFKFTVDEVEYQGDRPTFLKISGSRKWAKKVVRKYPINSTPQCLYDPSDPKSSVLSRNFETSFYFFPLFPLVFVIIGLATFCSGLFGWGFKPRKESTSISGGQGIEKFELGDKKLANQADLADKEWSIPKKLKPTNNRWIVLALAIGIATFWNGIVSVFVYQLFQDPEWFLALFLTPFILVGLMLISAVFYSIMCLFNPIVEIAMSSGAISPGGTVDIAWEIDGNANRFSNLRIQIIGEQSATYRQGTDTTTDRDVFEVIDVIETDRTEEIEFGSAAITIPVDTMHTFEAVNNKIMWIIAVHGSIPRWPDVRQSFEFRVKPSQGAR